MVRDANAIFQSSVTKSGTFQGVGLPITTPRRVMWAQVRYSGLFNTSGANAWQFSVDASYDTGSTYTTVSQYPAIACVNGAPGAKSGEIFIPFEVSASPATPYVVPLVRVSATLTGGGSGATVTYDSALAIGKDQSA